MSPRLGLDHYFIELMGHWLANGCISVQAGSVSIGPTGAYGLTVDHLAVQSQLKPRKFE